jgi:multiple sugar transport system substrate-binding protein
MVTMAGMKRRKGYWVGVSLVATLVLVACGGPAPRRQPRGGSGGEEETGGSGGNATGGSGSGGRASGGSGGSGGMAGGAGGAGGSAGGAAGGGIELKIAWWGSMDRHTRTMDVIKLFQKKYPNITFATEFDASTPYWVKMKAHADDNTLPDIMQQDYAYIGEWTAKGRLVALDDLSGAGKPLDISDIPKNALDGGRIDNKLMGMPLGTNTQCFVLDVDAFTKAGVALPTDAWTWDDFEKIATDIKTKNNTWGFGTALYLYTPWKSLFLSQGTWVFKPDNSAIGWTDDKPWVDHWKRELRLEMAGAIPTYDEEKMQFPDAADVAKTPIVMQKSAIEQIHSNQLLALQGAAGATRKFKLVGMPRIKGGGSSVYIKPSQYFSIVSGTKHAKEAAMFIDFFTNSIEANTVLAAERGVPVASKVLAALKPMLGPAQGEAFDLLDRVSKDARALPPPDPAQWSQILNTVYLPRVTLPILHGEITPEEGVTRFKDEANAILAGLVPPDGGAGDGGVSDAPGSDGGPVDAADGGATDVPTGAGHALLIVGAVQEASDMEIRARLETKLTVDVLPEATATSDDANGKAVVVITASASAAGTDTKFKDVTTPVLLMEPNLLGVMGMTAVAGTSHNTTTETRVTIVAGNNPLAAGLTGNVNVYTMPYRVVWGIPGNQAIKVATVFGQPTQVSIFAYPAGAQMVTGNAPGKRLSFFMHNNMVAGNVTESGFKLLDAAVDWLTAP